MASRSKAWVFGRSIAGIAGSNPAGGMDVCVCCQVQVSASGPPFVQRSPTECVVSECDIKAKKWGGLDPLRLSSHEKETHLYSVFIQNSCFLLQRSIADLCQTNSQIDISHDHHGFILHSTVLQRNCPCKLAYIYIYIYIHITSSPNIKWLSLPLQKLILGLLL